MLDYRIHTFANGLRLVYKQNTGTRIAHCGFTVDAGSRDEKPDEAGLAHLLEHMLFKGTAKRKSTQILNRLEEVGGELNAFTTKDKTCIYALIVDDYFERALELLTDITWYASFNEKELAKEKKVIADEIDMYLDTPEERIFDEFQELFYGKHAMGTNILGSRDSLKTFFPEHLRAFRQRCYGTDNTVFSFVGRLPFDKVVQMCNKHFEKIESRKNQVYRHAFTGYKPFKKTLHLPFVQCHVLAGCPAYAFTHPQRPALMLLSNMLGGPGLNSLFNLSLREKYGFTYGVETAYQSFADGGMFTIYWSADAENLKKSIRVILKDIEKIKTKPVSQATLKRYKMQFKGQLIMAEESKSGMMMMLGRSLLDLGKIDSLEEVLQSIDAVTAEELQKIALELFADDNLSWLVYEPAKG